VKSAVAGLLLTAASALALAQGLPVTPAQRATATQVAQAGVPLSELAPGAPDSHTVKQGDTLWGISGLFLRSPWRWPELWGMNMEEVRNPHRIYPGQVLKLDTSSGRAMLRLQAQAGQAEGDFPLVRVSPRTRYESVAEAAIAPVSMQAIGPFLAEMLVVDETTLSRAPRIVATESGRVMLSQGDRAYARSLPGAGGEGGLSAERGQPRQFRVFRNATPLKDPTTAEVLGYEAQYVGKARLVRGESVQESVNADRERQMQVVPATIDIVSTKEELRVGDRLVAEPSSDLPAFVPRAPEEAQAGQIVSVFGSAVHFAAQRSVVVLNRGREHGLEAGHVLSILKDGRVLVDGTDAGRTTIRLPSERNGLMMVFRTFDRLSYALVLDITEGVKVGDRFGNP
jgi:LysM repeat protein